MAERRFKLPLFVILCLGFCLTSLAGHAQTWKSDLDLDQVRRLAGESMAFLDDVETAWDALVIFDPRIVDDESVSVYERLILYLADRDAAVALIKGSQPASIRLRNGQSLAEFLSDRAQDGPIASFVNRSNGRCMDVKSASTANQANVQLYSCHGGANQLWERLPANATEEVFVALHSGKCLDVKGANGNAGANVQQFSCHFGANQRFFRGAVDPTHFTISASHTSLCVGRYNSNVKQRQCILGNSSKMHWRLSP